MRLMYSTKKQYWKIFDKDFNVKCHMRKKRFETQNIKY